jgi:hypothetical protein
MKLKTAKRIYERLNSETFGGLIDVRLWVSRSRDNFGHYDHNGIALSRVNIRDMATLAETIYHEMIHVYIDEIVEATDTAEHGTVFWQWYDYLLPHWIRGHYID